MSSPTDSPLQLNFEQQRKRAKDLRRAHQEGSVQAAVRIGRHLPRARGLPLESILASRFTLSEAQLVVAREAGFSSWPNLKQDVQAAADGGPERSEFLIDAALEGHDDAVAAALDRDPEAPWRSIYLAAAMADTEAVFAALDADAGAADRAGGRRAWKPLLYLCACRYRRAESGAARAGIARRLIALGASVTGREPGFSAAHGSTMSQDHDLLAIEAAAGRAASPELVGVLLEAGADLAQTTVALLQAVRGGNIEVLTMLLDVLPSNVFWQANWAIEESVVTGRKDMTRVLAERVELPAEGAVFAAIRLGRDSETIEILLGANVPSVRSVRRGQKAYRHAVRYGNAVAAEVLARWGADRSTVTDVDRVLGTCISGDRIALHGLLDKLGSLRPYLRDADHQILSWAIRTGREHAVPLLLQAGLDPDVPDVDGETPLHFAVRSGDVNIVEALIGHGASIDEGNFDGQTPLEIALALPDVVARERLTKLLLDRGASPARMSQLHPGALGQELMFERAADAVAFGDLETLREMLDEEPALVRARSPRVHRATLLHYCGANGVENPRQRTPADAPAIAQLLLDRGAAVNATCNLYRGGATTLAMALSSCHPVRAGLRIALAEVLLKAGAKIGGMVGANELPRAAALGRLDEVQRFFEEFDGPGGDLLKAQIQSAFFWACDFGRTRVAQFLLDQGADIRAQDQDGQTGVHLAVLAGHLDTVRLLVKRGSPLEIENAWGGTVLNHALWAAINHDPNVNYAPVIEVLIDAGARVAPGWVAWWRQENALFKASKPRIDELLERKSTSPP